MKKVYVHPTAVVVWGVTIEDARAHRLSKIKSENRD